MSQETRVTRAARDVAPPEPVATTGCFEGLVGDFAGGKYCFVVLALLLNHLFNHGVLLLS
jgi:hypothetical protein